MNFDFSPVWEGWRALAHGTGITVGITACALLVGCLPESYSKLPCKLCPSTY